MSDQEPFPTVQPVTDLSQEIFRQALSRNNEIHQAALAEMRRQTDEVHSQLRAVTQQRIQSMMLPGFHLISRAGQLDPDFWLEVTARARTTLQRHGELPTDQDDTSTT